MRILHTADWHLGKTLEQIPRLAEQKEFIDWLCNLADEEKIDLVLVAGDVFDVPNPSAAAESLFFQAVERLSSGGKRAVLAIAGNHDNPERLLAAAPLAYRHGVILLGYPKDQAVFPRTMGEGMTITDSGPGWLELFLPSAGERAVILTMPYPSESRLAELLTEDAQEAHIQKAYSQRVGEILQELSKKFRDDTVNLIISHLFLIGGQESDSERTLSVGGAMTVNPAVLPARAHYAAFGHLHRPQEIRGAQCPAYYAGSPLAYSFSEAAHAKAVYIVEAKPGEAAAVAARYIDCGRRLRRWTAKEGYGQALAWCEGKKDQGDWIDLEIYLDRVLTIEEQKTLRNLNPYIVNIRPVMIGGENAGPALEGRQGKNINELFREFYRWRNGVDIPDEIMDAFTELMTMDDDSQGDEPERGEAFEA